MSASKQTNALEEQEQPNYIKTPRLRHQVLLGNGILSLALLIGIIFFPKPFYNWLPIWITFSLGFLFLLNARWVSSVKKHLDSFRQLLIQLRTSKPSVAPSISLLPYWELQQLQDEIMAFSDLISRSGSTEEEGTTQLPPVELDLEKKELESVIHCMSDGLIIYDMSLNVILINPVMAQMLIPSNPAATGRLIQNPDDKLLFERCVSPPKMKEAHKAMLEEPRLPRSDVIELKNPVQFLKRYSSPLYKRENQQIGHVIIYHDITQEVKAERMRAEFITNASHELRTPVTSLKVLLESLLSGAKDDPDIRDEFLNNLMREVNRLHTLVNDLLDLARLETPHEKLTLTDVEVSKAVQDVVNTVQPLAQQKGVIIKQNIQREVTTIRADQLRLGQVMVNLVNNAVKFTPNGGEVRIIARKYTDGIEFKVQDTGIGIPKDDLPYIFDRFFRVEQNRQRGQNSGGSGLGLTITKKVVESHGGKITVESNSQGTTFTFTIPQEPANIIHQTSAVKSHQSS